MVAASTCTLNAQVLPTAVRLAGGTEHLHENTLKTLTEALAKLVGNLDGRSHTVNQRASMSCMMQRKEPTWDSCGVT